jgi:hypothetical protein
MLQPQRFDVTGEMIDRDQRLDRGPRRRLGKRNADQQRADEPGPLRHRDGVEIVPGGRGFVEGALDRPANIAEVLPRGEFGDDASPFTMDSDLRCDDAGA